MIWCIIGRGATLAWSGVVPPEVVLVIDSAGLLIRVMVSPCPLPFGHGSLYVGSGGQGGAERYRVATRPQTP